MQHATSDTVLGDFSDVQFQHFGILSTFFERDGGFHVRTENADGDLQDFRIAYTFGVYPLQQYLVEFQNGRLQTLPLAWDSRLAEDGGQRWFHIYGDEPIAHDDVLHWTGREQNWNYMCAECHSTNLAKNYSLESDSFDTTWSEINVSCEACHGPGSNHIAQAQAGEFTNSNGLSASLDDSGRAAWEMNVDTGIAVRSESRMRPPVQPEACGRCHSRRSVISAEYEFGRSLLDSHLPTLLDDVLYFPDGQIRDEVYVYGSFLQSRMYQAGVSCSDCHDPHSGRLVTGADPSDICASCHLSTRFDKAEHHHHPAGTVACVDCHMPSRDYMVVDGRRDHSFRIPRPDLSASTGSPNACNDCHVDQSAKWAVANVEEWYGKNDAADHFGFAIHAARAGDAGANKRLMATISDTSVPGIVRATALAELEPPLSREVAQLVQASLANPDPLIRIGALRALSGLRPELQLELATPLMQDQLLAVRIEAARVVSPMRTNLPLQFENVFRMAEQELVASMQAIAERPEAHAGLANNYADAGNIELALHEFQTALRMDPGSVQVRANFADLYRRLDRDDDAESLLREGIGRSSENAALHHALGLLLIRDGREEEGLDELRTATGSDDDNARYQYVYGVALNSLGQPAEAIELLTRARNRFPADFDIHWALATIFRDQGSKDAAKAIVEEMADRYPDVPAMQSLLESL